jgi:phage I-like protein
VSKPSPVTILSVASALVLPDGGGLPEWIMAFPPGTSRGVDGRGPYHLSDPAKVAAASIIPGKPLSIDYNHQTVFAAINGSPSPSAGWIDKLEVRDGALWAHVEKWTPAGAAAVAAQEYRYISPAFKHAATGEVESLASIGLVNAPNLAELPAISSQLSHIHGDPMTKEELAALAAAFGLPADTGLDKITAHARDLTATVAAAAQKAPLATGAPDPTQFVPMGAFNDVHARLGELTKVVAQSQASAAVDEAMRIGKVTPAMKEWALATAAQDMASFNKFLAGASVVVAPGALLPNTPPTAAAAQQDDSAVLAVCANLGISLDQYRKAQGITTAQDTGAKA